MTEKQLFAGVLAGLMTLPTVALSASPLGNVGTARVNAGTLSIEQRVGFTGDGERPSADERLQMRQHVDYGFNDWYAMRLVTAQDKRQGDNVEFSSFSVENWFQLIEKRDAGWDGGMRLIYSHRDGDKTPHTLDARLMAMGALDKDENWLWRHNSVFKHDVGENSRSGVSVEFRHQLMRRWKRASGSIKSWQLGAEMFNDFGKLNRLSGYRNQDHQLGPVVKVTFKNGFYLQSGYRAGLSDSAPDHLFKLFVGKSF